MLPLSFGWRYLSSKVTLDPRLSVSRNPTEGNPAVLSSNILRKSSSPGAPLTYFNDVGGGGGGGEGGSNDFIESEILAKSDFWGL